MSSAAPPKIEETVLSDLRRRLRAFRAVPTAGNHGWGRGVDPAYLVDLLRYWAEDYDWRRHEQRIRLLPWVELNCGSIPIRAIHQRADGDAPTVVLLHGWPDSVLRFERLLPLLTDLNVVVPSLPGYPFALPVPQGGLPAAAMAAAVGDALAELGVTHYVVSGGDIGSDVAEALAVARPDEVTALHLTDVSQHHFLVNPPTGLSGSE